MPRAAAPRRPGAPGSRSGSTPCQSFARLGPAAGQLTDSAARSTASARVSATGTPADSNDALLCEPPE